MYYVTINTPRGLSLAQVDGGYRFGSNISDQNETIKPHSKIHFQKQTDRKKNENVKTKLTI